MADQERMLKNVLVKTFDGYGELHCTLHIHLLCKECQVIDSFHVGDASEILVGSVFFIGFFLGFASPLPDISRAEPVSQSPRSRGRAGQNRRNSHIFLLLPNRKT